jgi:hypothetical protein
MTAESASMAPRVENKESESSDRKNPRMEDHWLYHELAKLLGLVQWKSSRPAIKEAAGWDRQGTAQTQTDMICTGMVQAVRKRRSNERSHTHECSMSTHEQERKAQRASSDWVLPMKKFQSRVCRSLPSCCQRPTGACRFPGPPWSRKLAEVGLMPKLKIASFPGLRHVPDDLMHGP